MGSRGRKNRAGAVTGRTRTVWLALLGAMTFTGGGMWALQGAPMPRLDGMSLPALVAAAGPSSLEAVYQTRSPVEKGRWTSIVIHHSGATYGTPASIEAEHRAMNLSGLGYHFVIGNGHGIGDGEVHVGYRWLDQLPGAHVAGPQGDRLNRTSIGICLVGDGHRHEFTQEQMTRLLDLVASLRATLDIPASQVYLHSDVAQVADPGLFFPAAAFREQVAAMR
jgi:N-acetyl-anhydromuramyl-L-alanine amidase AmpD